DSLASDRRTLAECNTGHAGAGGHGIRCRDCGTRAGASALILSYINPRHDNWTVGFTMAKHFQQVKSSSNPLFLFFKWGFSPCDSHPFSDCVANTKMPGLSF